jgi:hypothetical protein
MLRMLCKGLGFSIVVQLLWVFFDGLRFRVFVVTFKVVVQRNRI